MLFISSLLEANGLLKTVLGGWVLQKMESLSVEKSIFSKSQMFVLNAHRLIFSLAFNSMPKKSLTALAKQLFFSLIDSTPDVIGSQGERFHSVLSLFEESLKQFQAAGDHSLNRWELFTYLNSSREFCLENINGFLPPSPS